MTTLRIIIQDGRTELPEYVDGPPVEMLVANRPQADAVAEGARRLGMNPVIVHRATPVEKRASA